MASGAVPTRGIFQFETEGSPRDVVGSEKAKVLAATRRAVNAVRMVLLDGCNDASKSCPGDLSNICIILSSSLVVSVIVSAFMSFSCV